MHRVGFALSLPMNKYKIGDRVRFNDGVAFAFVGKTGVIEEKRNSSISGEVWVVRLDEPTSAGGNFSKCETLGVGEHCLDFA